MYIKPIDNFSGLPYPEAATPELIEKIKKLFVPLLSSMLGQVDENRVQYLSSEPQLWNNGSLGCPKPGYAYTQAFVPGYIVAFEYEGNVYRVHTNQLGNYIVSPDVQPNPATIEESPKIKRPSIFDLSAENNAIA